MEDEEPAAVDLTDPDLDEDGNVIVHTYVSHFPFFIRDFPEMASISHCVKCNIESNLFWAAARCKSHPIFFYYCRLNKVTIAYICFDTAKSRLTSP